MIQMQTKLNIADNSGAKKAMCIKVLGGSKNRYASIGDLIRISIKQATPNSKVKKGDVLYAVVVRTKKGINRSDGTSVKFDNNAVVVLNEKHQPIGTRVFGPVTKELRTDKFMKVVSLAMEVL